jgi:HTH-type transcriptional regulator/antitoxin HipB
MSKIKPKTKSIKGCRTFDEILDVEYGTQGTPERDAFEHASSVRCRARKKERQVGIGKPLTVFDLQAKRFVQVFS